MKKIVLGTLVTVAFSASLFAGQSAMCKGCHGANGEKNIIVHSAIPNKLSKADFLSAMKGYKDGTRKGHGKEGMMRSWAMRSNHEAIAKEWNLK